MRQKVTFGGLQASEHELCACAREPRSIYGTQSAVVNMLPEIREPLHGRENHSTTQTRLDSQITNH